VSSQDDVVADHFTLKHGRNKTMKIDKIISKKSSKRAKKPERNQIIYVVRIVQLKLL